jgi:uncharacterized phage infection (PIP) family protein YhgE
MKVKIILGIGFVVAAIVAILFFLQVNNLKLQLQQSKAESEQLQSQLQQSKTNSEQLQPQLQRSKAESEQLQSQLQQSKTNSEQLQSQLQQSKAESEQLQSQLQQSKTNSEQLQLQLQQSKAESEQLQSQLAEDESQIAQLQPLANKARQMPITHKFVKSLFGPGYWLEVINISRTSLRFEVTVAALNKSFSLVIDGGKVGIVRGFASGDQIEIKSDGYDSVKLTVPQ